MKIILVIIALVVTGCASFSQNTEAATANAVTAGANAALPLLIEAYKQEGLKTINDQTIKTRPEVEAKLADIEKRWEKVWKAWGVLRVAEDTWATAIEMDGDTTAAFMGVRTAYCGLQALWPKEIPAMPIVPISCGGVK